MTARLLVAVASAHETAVVTVLDASRQLTLARRCADVADLLAAATAGVGTHAVVSPDLPHLERDVIDQLRRLGVALVGVVADEPGEQRLRQLGVESIVGVDAIATQIEQVVLGAGHGEDRLDQAIGRDGPDERGSPDPLDARLDAALAGDLSAVSVTAAGVTGSALDRRRPGPRRAHRGLGTDRVAGPHHRRSHACGGVCGGRAESAPRQRGHLRRDDRSGAWPP